MTISVLITRVMPLTAIRHQDVPDPRMLGEVLRRAVKEGA